MSLQPTWKLQNYLKKINVIQHRNFIFIFYFSAEFVGVSGRGSQISGCCDAEDVFVAERFGQPVVFVNVLLTLDPFRIDKNIVPCKAQRHLPISRRSFSPNRLKPQMAATCLLFRYKFEHDWNIFIFILIVKFVNHRSVLGIVPYKNI